MLKRTPFKRKPPAPYVKPERAPRPPLTPLQRTPRYGSFDAVMAVAKEAPARHEGYRRLVAAMPCICCGKAGPSQCAHANTGKGMAMKVSDHMTFPLCPDCHRAFDQGAMFDKAERRRVEKDWVAKTKEGLSRG